MSTGYPPASKYRAKHDQRNLKIAEKLTRINTDLPHEIACPLGGQAVISRGEHGFLFTTKGTKNHEKNKN